MTTLTPAEVEAALVSTIAGHPDENARRILAELPAKQAANRAHLNSRNETTMNISRLHPARWSLGTWVAVVVAPLFLALGIAVLVALNAQTAAIQDADYRACVAAEGLDASIPAEDMVRIAKLCTAKVYGD